MQSFKRPAFEACGAPGGFYLNYKLPSKNKPPLFPYRLFSSLRSAFVL